jgi:hypothetical protein
MTDHGSMPKQAALNIGKNDLDVVPPYFVNLRKDLYDTIASLLEEDIDVLREHMPRRLAKEAMKLMLAFSDEIQQFS